MAMGGWLHCVLLFVARSPPRGPDGVGGGAAASRDEQEREGAERLQRILVALGACRLEPLRGGMCGAWCKAVASGTQAAAERRTMSSWPGLDTSSWPAIVSSSTRTTFVKYTIQLPPWQQPLQTCHAGGTSHKQKCKPKELESKVSARADKGGQFLACTQVIGGLRDDLGHIGTTTRSALQAGQRGGRHPFRQNLQPVATTWQLNRDPAPTLRQMRFRWVISRTGQRRPTPATFRNMGLRFPNKVAMPWAGLWPLRRASQPRRGRSAQRKQARRRSRTT